ncbi:unnamed protein product [Nyctereutes procyonoides]|uniref:(raccoon dog) hypothetical protein n=1 Tax=Nyctereutes procyonoides TaxID=34880 RepID=A0A811YPN8_NYCPR|nr:unnamed protein product [Nyctereutes procyonoides]
MNHIDCFTKHLMEKRQSLQKMVLGKLDCHMQKNVTGSLSYTGQLPFAVVGSRDEVKVGKRMVRGRQYPWGVLQVENENHCDFIKLRDMLLCINMEDLKEQTHIQHYERYRCCKLKKTGFTDVGPDNKPLREEEELKQKFMQRVKEKETTFKESEKEANCKSIHTGQSDRKQMYKAFSEKEKIIENMISMQQLGLADKESGGSQVNF